MNDVERFDILLKPEIEQLKQHKLNKFDVNTHFSVSQIIVKLYVLTRKQLAAKTEAQKPILMTQDEPGSGPLVCPH